MTAIEQALEAAWTGADPGPTVLADWPPSRRRFPPGPVQPLLRHGQTPPAAPAFATSTPATASGAIAAAAISAAVSAAAPPHTTSDPVLASLGALLDLSLAGDPARKVGGVRLRRVPSAGGRYPVNAHLGPACYDPIAHALHGSPGNTITLALQPQRTTWRYGPRSFPVLLLDLGHALAAVLTAARTLGIPATAAFTPTPPRHGEYPLITVYLGLSTTEQSAPSPVPLPDPPGLPLIEAALTELSTHAQVPLPWTPPEVAPDTLLARHTAPWPTRGPITLPDHGLLETRPTADLAAGSCGQPQLAEAELLLLATGEPTPLNLIRAGLAVHRAWLLATAAGLAARPAGCWIRTRHHGQRVLHALAVGPKD